MNEVEKVDKVLGFFQSNDLRILNPEPFRANRNKRSANSRLGSGFWENNPNKDFYKDTIDGFLLGCGLAGIQLPIFNVMTSS